ncbi:MULTISPECIES: alpha/beta fold hydrolase [unclassified Streptomyces]|uniref:thioesterase domain-containing protein n=1 Tax=unclassified Streptomyces TaxID=2593676 RepID=UPI0033B235DF
MPSPIDARPSARLIPLGSADPDRDVIFLVHAIGGTVHSYAALAKCLQKTHAVVGIEAFGIRDDDPPVNTLGEIVERYVEAVRTVSPAGPYRLGGWSMGGIVAFEMARRLEEEGQEVECVTLLDSPFTLSRADLGYADTSGGRSLAARFAEDVSDSLGWSMPTAGSVDADPLGWLAAAIAGGGGEEAADRIEVVREELERRFAVFKAHAEALTGYRPSGTVAADLRVLIPYDSPNIGTASGWTAATRGRFRHGEVRGDHYTFLRAPVVTEVAAFVAAGR